MDRERKKRLQTIRLAITETIMVISIVALVIILTFVAMGYGLNKDGEVGQSGLLQIRSVPTGAIVEIDNEIISAKTNTSKMLPAGEHKVKLSKSGYDTWEKTVLSESGWLLKLDYPRLFLTDRSAEKVREYTSDISFFAPAPSHEYIVYSVASSDDWTLLNVSNSNDVTETTLKTSEILEKRTVLSLTWNKNSDKILVQTKNNDSTEWIIININDVNKSINLSKTFGMNFSELKFASDNGERLIALENGNLRTVMASDRTISQILASDIENFTQDEKHIVYITRGHEVKLFQEGSDDIRLASYQPEQKVNVAFGEYLSRSYIAISVDKMVYYYRGNLPTKDDNLDSMELALKKELAFIPDWISTDARSEFYIAKSGNNLAVYDAELNKLSEYSIESDSYFFLDDYLIANIDNDKMIVRDFDGANRRELTDATGAGFIARDSKTLFFIKSDRGNSSIMREKISE